MRAKCTDCEFKNATSIKDWGTLVVCSHAQKENSSVEALKICNGEMETRNLLCTLLHRTKTGGVTGGERSPQLALGPLFCCTANVKPAIASGPLREQPITRPVIWFPQNERAARLPFERPSAASFGGIGDWVKRPNYKRATPQFCFNLLGSWPDRVSGLIGCGEAEASNARRLHVAVRRTLGRRQWFVACGIDAVA